jgi:hypothetical protein
MMVINEREFRGYYEDATIDKRGMDFTRMN